MHSLLRTSKGLIGVTLMFSLLVIGVGADFISPRDPISQELTARLTAPASATRETGATTSWGPIQWDGMCCRE